MRWGHAMLNFLKALGRDSRGATAIEYGLIVSLIVVAMIAALGQMAGSAGSMWANVSSNSVSAMSRN